MPRSGQELLLLNRQRGGGYSAFVQSLNPVVWLRMTETAGTTAVNSGTGGTSFNGTIGGTTTLGQTGKLGANESFLFDGATSIVTVTNGAAIQGLTNFTLMMLCNPASSGESNLGRLFEKGSEFSFRLSSGVLVGLVNCASTNALRTSSTNFATSAYSALAMIYNDSTKMLRIFINGTEVSYASSTTGVGTRASNTNAVTIGNIASQAFTFNGNIDEALIFDSIQSDANILRYAQLAGVA